MTITKLLEKTHIQKVGKESVVVLPLKTWKDIEEKLEDLEMAQSKTFRRKIIKARKEKKLYRK